MKSGFTSLVLVLLGQHIKSFVIAPHGLQARPGRLAGPVLRTRQPHAVKPLPRYVSMDGAEQGGEGLRPPAAVAASAGAQAQAEAAAAPGDGAVFDALVNQFLNPKGSNLTATVEEFLDMCDYAFLMHLNMLIGEAGPKSERGMRLTEVGKEINLAMQRRLVVADANLRDILSAAPDIKAMEGKLKRCLRTGQVDMAFMVMLNMNLAQAREADGAENAVMVLTHLNTVIMEALDERVAPEVRLLRLLLRTTCKGVREQMLKDNLILPARAGAGGGADGNGEGAVESGSGSPGAWRRVEVTPDALRGAIGELVQQARQIGKEYDAGLTASLRGLEEELLEVAGGVLRPHTPGLD